MQTCRFSLCLYSGCHLSIQNTCWNKMKVRDGRGTVNTITERHILTSGTPLPSEYDDQRSSHWLQWPIECCFSSRTETGLTIGFWWTKRATHVLKSGWFMLNLDTWALKRSCHLAHSQQSHRDYVENSNQFIFAPSAHPRCFFLWPLLQNTRWFWV